MTEFEVFLPDNPIISALLHLVIDFLLAERELKFEELFPFNFSEGSLLL